jgi:hypothetical protein
MIVVHVLKHLVEDNIQWFINNCLRLLRLSITRKTLTKTIILPYFFLIRYILHMIWKIDRKKVILAKNVKKR